MGKGSGITGTGLMQRIAEPSRVFNCRFPGEATYEVVCKIGKGSYGTVVKARSRRTGEEVAIKHIDRVFADPADAVRTIREVKLLRVLDHPAIVNVRTVLQPANPASFDDIFIVTELLSSDLSQLIRKREPTTPGQKRWLAYQLFEGLAYIHSAHVYHRDLKPANLLVSAPDADGMRTLKLCDFGLARASFDSEAAAASEQEEGPVLWTDYVATRWYRAPELICSHRGGNYDGSIDVWAAGCILAELWRGRALFPARNLYHQLDLITAFVGTPNADMVGQLRNKKAATYLTSLKTRQPSNWAKAFNKNDVVGKDAGDEEMAGSFELLRELLRFDAAQRMDGSNALRHPVFADCVARRLRRDGGAAQPELAQPRREDFSFENKELGLSVAELRATLHGEILLFNANAGSQASPNFAPTSSAAVRTQMKVLSLDGSSENLEGLKRIQPSASMPGPQMAQLSATLSANPAAKTTQLPPAAATAVGSTQQLSPSGGPATSAGPPSFTRSSSPTRAAGAAAAAARSPSPSRGRDRARSPARCRSRSRSPAPAFTACRGVPTPDDCSPVCADRSPTGKRDMFPGDLWSNPAPLAFDVSMYGDMVSIGLPVESLQNMGADSPSGYRPPNKIRHAHVDTSAVTGDTWAKSPSPDAPGVGKAISNFFDRVMMARTMAYSTGLGDDAEWMTVVDAGYAFA